MNITREVSATPRLHHGELLLRVGTTSGVWETFPCGRESVFDITCVAGLFNANEGAYPTEDDRPAVYNLHGNVTTTQNGASYTNYEDIEPGIELLPDMPAMYITNPITDPDRVEEATRQMFDHSSLLYNLDTLETTFCGHDVIGRLMLILADLSSDYENHQATRVLSLSALAVNYAQRKIQG